MMMRRLSSFLAVRHRGEGRNQKFPEHATLAPGLRRGDEEEEEGRAQESGFTLVELMVVIVIIGLLATIVVINVLPSQDRAMVQKARSDVALLEQALEMYRLDTMSYPRTEQGLGALVQPPSGLAQPGRYRQGGYIKKLPDDPWGAPYQYANPGSHGGPFDIFSLGADGKPGGEGENEDIGSWQ